MSKKIIVGDTNLIAFKRMLKEIDATQDSILVVPDKFSLNAELMLLQAKNLTSNFNVRVFSLTKLASEILKDKISDRKIIDKNISIMIVSSIISDNLEKFKFFKEIKDINKFAEDIFSIISQFITSKVDKTNEILDENLRDKFYDLMLIKDEYLKRTANYLVDASCKFDLFFDEIKNSSYIKNSNVYFGMFLSLTEQTKEIIKEICQFAKSFCFSIGKSENRVNNNEIFDFLKSTFKDAEITKVEQTSEFKKFILSNFFTNRKDKFETKAVKVYETKTVDDEILNLCNNISFDIKINGLRFSDIGIIVPNINSYSQKITKAFENYNISYFLDSSIALSSTSYAKFILLFIKTLNHFDIKDLITLVKSSYINIDENDKLDFERFVLKFDIKDIFNTKFYTKDEFFGGFSRVFDNVMKKLLEFKVQTKDFTVKDFFANFNKLLNEFGVKEKLNEKIDTLREIDKIKYRQVSQVEAKTDECFKSIEDFCEDFSLNKIYYYLSLCFDNTSISLPLASVDAVFVGDYENSFYKSYKKIYVLSMDSKSFPSLMKDTNIFSDAELSKLEKDKIIYPKLADTNKLNYYKAFESLLSFEDELVLSYSITDDEGNKNFPSLFLKNFLERILVHGKKLTPFKISKELLFELSPQEYINILPFKFASKRDLIKEYFSAPQNQKKILKNLLEKNLQFSFCEEKIDKITPSLIEKNIFSSSSLENYFTCPNKFLFNDVLKLKPFEKNEFNPLVIGNIVHLALKEFGEKLKKGDVDEKTKKEIVDNIFRRKEFQKVFFVKNAKILIENLKKEIYRLFEFVQKEQIFSNFKMAKLEFEFLEEIDNFKLKGFVDRIDESKDEFIIIDYKTGNTKIDFKDIVLTKKIQLILYSIVLEKILNKPCAGVYYLTITDDYSKEKKRNIYLNGITVLENNNLKNLDTSCEEKSQFFDFKEKYNLKRSEFKNLQNYVLEKIKEAVNKIKCGEFTSSPQKMKDLSSCDYCNYKEICFEKNERKVEYNEKILREILDD